jgi:hypothetical protein
MHPVASLKDDPSIAGSEWLYRTIHRTYLKEGNTVSSGAFKSNTNPHTSVEIASLTAPEQTLRRRPNDIGVVQLLTGKVRAIRPGVIGVARDPIPASDGEAANPAHAVIVRQLEPKSVYRESARKLACLCVWVLGPDLARL